MNRDFYFYFLIRKIEDREQIHLCRIEQKIVSGFFGEKLIREGSPFPLALRKRAHVGREK